MANISGERDPLVNNKDVTVPMDTTTPAPKKWKGADLKLLAITVGVGFIFFVLPCPEAVPRKGWNLLAIFMGTITGVILGPLPLGAVALLGLGMTVLTGTLKFDDAFAAMGDKIPWTLAVAYFFAKALNEKPGNPGLGRRIAYLFVRTFGKSMLGLTYSLVFCEALLSPSIPSVAARAGGIFRPLVIALAEACGSKVGDGTERVCGAYLCLTCFQTSTISSAMFVTAMAANPLVVKGCAEVTGIEISWGTWAAAAIVPGITALIVVPLVIFMLYPPTVKTLPEAPQMAQAKLDAMGSITSDEIITLCTLIMTVCLWVFGEALGVHAVAAALLGLGVLLVCGILTWKECLQETTAWDTLTWFGALIAMAGQLKTLGVIEWFANQVTAAVDGLPWQVAVVVLILIYYYSHYFFASGAAHIGAMFTAFLTVAVKLGAPGLQTALILGMLSNTMGGLTHFGIGSAPPYFSAGYVPLSTWWFVGGVCSIVNILIFGVIGYIWMGVIF